VSPAFTLAQSRSGYSACVRQRRTRARFSLLHAAVCCPVRAFRVAELPYKNLPGAAASGEPRGWQGGPPVPDCIIQGRQMREAHQAPRLPRRAALRRVPPAR
jgi:hypothetical protein